MDQMNLRRFLSSRERSVEKKQAGYFSACSLQLTRDTSQTSIARPANSFFAFPLDQPLFTVVFALATVQ